MKVGRKRERTASRRRCSKADIKNVIKEHWELHKKNKTKESVIEAKSAKAVKVDVSGQKMSSEIEVTENVKGESGKATPVPSQSHGSTRWMAWGGRECGEGRQGWQPSAVGGWGSGG